MNAVESEKGMDDVDNTRRTLHDANAIDERSPDSSLPVPAQRSSLTEVWTNTVHIRVVFNQLMKKTGARTRTMTRARLLIQPRHQSVMKLTRLMGVVDR